jgi:hypothetical protein
MSEMNWRETADARSLTIVIPSNVDVSKDEVESAVQSIIEESENDIEESEDGIRQFERGYQT